MNSFLKKLTVFTIVTFIFVSVVVAQPSKENKRAVKSTPSERMIPGGLAHFDELTGVVKIEGKGEKQKIYIITDDKSKILLELTGGPSFDKKENAKKEKKSFNKKDQHVKKEKFNKDKTLSMPENFDKDKMPPMPEGFDKDKMPPMPEGFDKDKMPTKPENFDKDKMPPMPEGFDKNKMPTLPKPFAKEDLTALKGKTVTLVGKLNSDGKTFNVIGIVDK